MRGEFLGPLADRFGVVEDRRPSHRSAPASEGADAAGTLVGVSVEHRHVVHWDAELLAGDLRPRRLVSLPVRRGAAPNGDRTVGLDGDAAGFPGAESADLHVAGEADPEQLSAALGAPPGLFGPKTRVVAGLERQIERLFVFPAVVGQPGRRPVGELVRRDQVAAADVRRVHPEPAGQHVERPLDQVGGLRASRAPVGLVRRGVREGPLGPGVGGADVVGPDDHGPGEGGSGGSGPAEVGAGVVEDVQIAMPHPPVAVGRDAERHEEVSAVGGGLEVLGAGGVPADRAAEPQGEPGDEDLLGIEVRLGAEPAADFGSDGPDALLRDAQNARDA